MANSSLSTQGSAPGGAYIQPSPGIVIQATTDADVNGLLQQSVASPNSGFAYLGTVAYRDCQITVQAGSKASAPSAGGTVVSITPGAAGLWEISGLVAISGTTVGTVETNNLALFVGTTAAIANITYPVQGTTGGLGAVAVTPIIANLGSATTVQVQAVAGATGSSVYSATLVARRVG